MWPPLTIHTILITIYIHIYYNTTIIIIIIYYNSIIKILLSKFWSREALQHCGPPLTAAPLAVAPYYTYYINYNIYYITINTAVYVIVALLILLVIYYNLIECR